MHKRDWLAIILIAFITVSCSTLTAQPQVTETPVVETDPRPFENEQFGFTIPAGWGLTISSGDYYGFGLEKMVVIHNAPLLADSKTFFTVATAALPSGERLAERFKLAYQDAVPEIEEQVESQFERNGLSGPEITYKRPWGEPWWKFQDIWLEKDSVVYLLSFRASPFTFEDHLVTLDLILDSFYFKDPIE